MSTFEEMNLLIELSTNMPRYHYYIETVSILFFYGQAKSDVLHYLLRGSTIEEIGIWKT